MTDPEIAQKAPFAVEVEAGKIYFWCACGRSATQPFCDGAHKVTDITPVKYKSQKAEKLWFCGCKQTKGKPFCDGTHKSL